MKISIIIPEGNWMLNLVPELMNFRHEVLVNRCTIDCDVIFATERTMTPFVTALHKQFPKIPLVVLNWDWYEYIDKTKGTYPGFIQLLKEAKDVWSGDMDTAKTTEKDIGVKSEFSPYIFIMPWEWEGTKRDWGYIMNGSRKDPNKRVDWYEKAARELNIPFKSYCPNINSRSDYIRTLKNCSFYVTASRETGVTIPDTEAAYCKKPFLYPDLPGGREMWGDSATYYKRDDFQDFKAKMKWLWENRKSEEVQKKVEECYAITNERFLPKHMAKSIHERLTKILS